MTLAIDPAEPTTQECAARYAALGFRVLPIRPGGKHPPMTAWQDAATTRPEAVKAWWGGLYRGHGIGIATGHLDNGDPWFVLDVDDDADRGKNGSDELAWLEGIHGDLPDTVTSVTGSGGRHFFLRVPKGRPTPRNDQSGRIAPSLDIRGEGGQVVCAPSVHPNGTAYMWEIDHAPGEVEMAEAPEWLMHLLTSVAPVPERGTTKAPPSGTRDPFMRATDDGPAQRYNERTTWHQLLEADGWTLSSDRNGEQGWTRPGKDARQGISATVGHEGRDVLKVFTSSHPMLPAEWCGNRFQYLAATSYGGDQSAAAHALLDGERFLMNEHIRVGTPTQETPPEGVETSEYDAELLAMLIDWPTFWLKEAAEANWLAEPIFAIGRAHAIYAPGGTGKSLFALWLAATLATGGAGLDGHPVEARRILYLDYEMTADDLIERLETMGFSAETVLTNLSYALLPSLPPADAPEGGKAIGRLAQLVDAEMVILDTFSRAVEGDENDADTVRSFYRWTGLHLKAEGRAFARIDHAGKDIEKGQRGSSAKNDDVDVVWQMVKAEGGFTLTAKKRRMGWVPETLALQQFDEPTLHYRIVQDVTPAGTAKVIADLDALDVSPLYGYRVAGQALRDADRGARNEIVRAAQKIRNQRLNVFSPVDNRLKPVDKCAPTIGAHPHSGDAPQVPGLAGAHPTNPLVDDRAHLGAHRGAGGGAEGGAPLSLIGGAPSASPEAPLDDPGLF